MKGGRGLDESRRTPWSGSRRGAPRGAGLRGAPCPRLLCTPPPAQLRSACPAHRLDDGQAAAGQRLGGGQAQVGQQALHGASRGAGEQQAAVRWRGGEVARRGTGWQSGRRGRLRQSAPAPVRGTCFQLGKTREQTWKAALVGASTVATRPVSARASAAPAACSKVGSGRSRLDGDRAACALGQAPGTWGGREVGHRLPAKQARGAGAVVCQCSAAGVASQVQAKWHSRWRQPPGWRGQGWRQPARPRSGTAGQEAEGKEA